MTANGDLIPTVICAHRFFVEKKIKELQVKHNELKNTIKSQPEKIKIGEIMNNVYIHFKYTSNSANSIK